VAEEELGAIEEFVEYGLQRRANIVIYNSFTDYKQSNIGLGIDWQNTGGVTKLVNNKILLYFDGNLNELRIRLRQGIAQVLVENLLFGDDLGEFASNQAFLMLLKTGALHWTTNSNQPCCLAITGPSINLLSVNPIWQDMLFGSLLVNNIKRTTSLISFTCLGSTKASTLQV
jgi:hypothetical protein